MDKVQKHNSFNTNTTSSESYRSYLYSSLLKVAIVIARPLKKQIKDVTRKQEKIELITVNLQ
jgi:hypothetical protein